MYDEQNRRIRRWTVEEAQELVLREPPHDSHMSRDWSTQKAGETWDEAVRMMIEGDPKSARGLKKYLGVLARVRQGKRSLTRWGEAGSQVDVARFLSGEPECMMETVRARRAAPVLKIAVERCVPHYVTAEEIRATGASVLAVVEALRTSGVPSEVWVTFSINTNYSRDGGTYSLSEQVLVQEAGYALDLDRLAFWVGNPASFRRLAFALYEQEPQAVRDKFNIKTSGSYGSASSSPPNEDEFDEAAPSWSSDAEAWLRAVLDRRAGIDVLDTKE